MFAIFTPLLLFIAFILLLLVSLSIPIIKTIYLFSLSAHVSSSLLHSGVSAGVKFGVWGYCTENTDTSVLGINHSSKGHCSKASLGYSFDNTISDALHVSGLEDIISRTLSAALVLHLVACILTFIALVVSLSILRRRNSGTPSRISSILTLGFASLAAIISSIVFLIDVTFIATVHNKVKKDTDNDLELNWGNAVWMVLGATIVLWISIVGACCGICAIRRSTKAATY